MTPTTTIKSAKPREPDKKAISSLPHRQLRNARQRQSEIDKCSLPHRQLRKSSSMICTGADCLLDAVAFVWDVFRIEKIKENLKQKTDNKRFCLPVEQLAMSI